MSEDNELIVIPMGGSGDVSEIGRGPARPIPDDFASIEAFLNHATQYVHDFWNSQDDPKASFTPMVIAVCENGDVVPMVIAANFDEQDKNQFVYYCQKNFQTWNVVRYAFISESWVAQEDPNTPPDKRRPPSEHEDKIEAMFIQIMDKNGKHGFRSYEMIRDWTSGKVVKLEQRYMLPEIGSEESPTIGGRFSLLLKPPQNAATNPDNVARLQMLNFVLHPPEEVLRPRCEELGLDYDKIKAKGENLWDRIEVVHEKIANTPPWKSKEIIDEANIIIREAKNFITQFVKLDDGEKPQKRNLN